MCIVKTGETMYLKTNKAVTFVPGSTITDVSMYVAYDVKDGTKTVIPKGTRIVGNWVSDAFMAQFQVHKIYLCGERPMTADSVPYELSTLYNDVEVKNANYLYKKRRYVSTANIKRRLVNVNCVTQVLKDNNLNTNYLETGSEVEMVLTSDLFL